MKSVREYRKIIGGIAEDDQSMMGMLSGSIRMKTNFALGGGAVFFLYAIARGHKWIPYTIIGMMLGAGLGWLVEEIRNEIYQSEK